MAQSWLILRNSDYLFASIHIYDPSRNKYVILYFTGRGAATGTAGASRGKSAILRAQAARGRGRAVPGGGMERGGMRGGGFGGGRGGFRGRGDH